MVQKHYLAVHKILVELTLIFSFSKAEPTKVEWKSTQEKLEASLWASKLYPQGYNLKSVLLCNI